MAAFEYRQALEIRDALARRGVQYLFIGKSGAILLGYPDTTQDAVPVCHPDAGSDPGLTQV
jgi:saccharopine dehydrogenase-like NADP-dependent oxidoreductase